MATKAKSFDLNVDDVKTFFLLLEKEYGISLDQSKTYLLNARLNSVAKTASVPSVGVLISEIIKDPRHPFRDLAFDALTTNETSFFRDPAFYESLLNIVIPNALLNKQRVKRLRFWSCAVATGQEAYSIAMLLTEDFPELASWDVEILATDISSEALTKAKLGIYSDTELKRGIDKTRFEKYFVSSEKKGFYEIRKDIKGMVRFEDLNLLRDTYPRGKFDFVMLRNVLIYFSSVNKLAVLDRVHSSIDTQGGLLFLGGSESIMGHPKYKMIQHPKWTAYGLLGENFS